MTDTTTNRRLRGPARQHLSLVGVIGTLLIGTSWAMSNPPGAAPDEGSHYVRAVASAFGNNTGRRYVPLPPKPTPRHILDSDVHRQFDVPAEFAPLPSWGCHRFTPDSAACTGEHSPPPGGLATVTTGVGPYPPLFYVLVGVPARFAGAAVEGLYAARMTGMLITSLLLLVAWWAARDMWTRVAVVLATTPMLVFLGASVTVSGIEVAAAIAFASVSARVARGPSNRRMWVAFGLSGVALASARILGPAWIAFDVAFLLVAVGPRVLAARVAASRSAALACSVVAGAWVVTAVWDLVAAPHTPSSIADAIRSIPETVALVPNLLDQSVGVFGWLDTFLPSWVTWVVVGLQLGLVALAAAVASWRDRLALVLGMIGIFVSLVAVDGLTQLPTGFRVQARYLMPLTTMFLVLVGSGLGVRPAPSIRARIYLPAAGLFAVVIAMLIHPLAWFVNSRRSAVGALGPVMFAGDAAWAPPGSWQLWIGVVAAGSCAVLVSVVTTISGSRVDGPRDPGDGRAAVHSPSSRELIHRPDSVS